MAGYNTGHVFLRLEEVPWLPVSVMSNCMHRPDPS